MKNQKDMITKIENMPLNQMNETLDNIPSIFSRVETVLGKPLKVIDEERLEKIKQRMQEINDKIYNFGRMDSQTTRKLMTLQMLFSADSTYRILAQILAQIEKTQMAISQNYIELKKGYVEVIDLQKKIEQTDDPTEKIKLELDLQEKIVSISNCFAYLEGAIKEVGFLQDAYEQIKRNKNIPDDWDEIDYEKAEIKAHIRNAFRLGIRDFLSNGRLNVATCEYFEQFGISPIEAIFHIQNYIEKCNQKLREASQINNYNSLPDYDDFQDFLNTMAEIYKDSYKKACRRMGLDDDIISRDFILMSIRNKQKYQLLEEGKSDD